MGMLSLECPASPFLLEESSRLAPFLEPEAAAGAGFRRKCLVFNVHASDARLDGGTSRNGKNHIPSDLVVGRLSTTLIASRGEDLQVEHPV